MDRNRRMATSDHQPKDPNQPAGPAEKCHRDERVRGQRRDYAMRSGTKRVNQMAAIKLTSGQKVQRGRKHADPGGVGDGMQEKLRQWNGVSKVEFRQQTGE